MNSDPIAARVISFEQGEDAAPDAPRWGVAVDFGNGKHVTYPVATRERAEADLKRLQRGERPFWGPLAAMLQPDWDAFKRMK